MQTKHKEKTGASKVTARPVPAQQLPGQFSQAGGEGNQKPEGAVEQSGAVCVEIGDSLHKSCPL